VSDDILSVIPADPYWQPDQNQAGRAVSAVAALLPEGLDGMEPEIEVERHQSVHVVDCGGNLSTITCPRCATQIDTSWWGDLIEERGEGGFDDLTAVLPCCGRTESLTGLDYDWPCGFARFEIAIWNPERDWFDDEELAEIAEALGHPVRQIVTHI
jgi:NAD-dependent SIR2 family protein deacetylase